MFRGIFAGILGNVGQDIDQFLGTGNFSSTFKKQYGNYGRELYIPQHFKSEQEAQEAFKRIYGREPQFLYPGSKEWE